MLIFAVHKSSKIHCSNTYYTVSAAVGICCVIIAGCQKSAKCIHIAVIISIFAKNNVEPLGQYYKGRKQLIAGCGIIVTAHRPYIQFIRWHGRLRSVTNILRTILYIPKSGFGHKNIYLSV